MSMHCDSLWVTAGSVRKLVRANGNELNGGELANRTGVFSWAAAQSRAGSSLFLDLTVSFTPSKGGGERAARKTGEVNWEAIPTLTKLCNTLLRDYYKTKGNYGERHG